MLTKINDLRKLKRSIFIIATNYEKRIDAAIKRTGRVDKKYLLGLPNAALRAKILGISKEKFEDHLNESSALFAFEDLMGAKNDAVSDNKEFENVLDDLETAEEELKNAEVAKNTSPSYSSNQAVIDAKEIISKLQKKTQEFQLSISEKLNRREPPTSVKNYLELISANEKFPEEELEGLLFLIKEAHSPNENQSEDLGATKTAPLAKIDRVKGISRLDEELQKLLEDLGLPKKRREKKC
jgi:SpoVK/Ycf46/Vps4 family AAA+-type ATPase